MASPDLRQTSTTRCAEIEGGFCPIYYRTLTNYIKGRKYFDSEDYALSATKKAGDSSLVRTGTAHPLRESIPRPHAPVPTASNISNYAYKDIYVKKSPSPEIVGNLSTSELTLEITRLKVLQINEGQQIRYLSTAVNTR